MCGILGFTGKKDLVTTDKLLDVIQHRGFDDRVVEYAGGVNLGMNRLAVIDLHRGLYPMRYKHWVMVYNGEIYNHLELRKELSKSGIKFKTNSDAEVILPLYDQWGGQGLVRLEGMFAIAIIDTNKQEIILARDKAGEKGLYYHFNGERFSFGSELKVLLKSNFIEKKLNLNTLGDYLSHGSIAGAETLVTGVKKLLPAQFLVLNLKGKTVQTQIYWRPKIQPKLNLKSFEERRENMEVLITQAVTSRLIADVPLGTFLSGGVDSSLVTAIAVKHNHKLRTFSVAFPESKWYDESHYSRMAADYLGTDHTQVDCTAATARTVMERIGELIDEPIADPAVLPTFLLSKLARQTVPVVLTGEGADELWGGYYRYHKYLLKLKLQRRLRQVPGLVTFRQRYFPNRFKRILSPFDKTYAALNVWGEAELNQLLNKEVSISPVSTEVAKIACEDPLMAMQLNDFQSYLPSQLLFKVDKFSMINNLEARAPYLDSNLINFAMSLPATDKIRRLQGKYILKKVAEAYLPHDIVWRTKRGFSLPLGRWFREDYRDLVNESIEILKNFRDVFKVDYFELMVKQHGQMRGENDYRDKIWSMVVLARWLDFYKITL